MTDLPADRTITELVAEELLLQKQIVEAQANRAAALTSANHARAEKARGRGSLAEVKAAEAVYAKANADLETLESGLDAIATELQAARETRMAEYIDALESERASLEAEVASLCGLVDDSLPPIAEACRRLIHIHNRAEHLRVELRGFGLEPKPWGKADGLVGLAVQSLATACGVPYKAPRLDRARTLREAIGLSK